MLSNSTQQLDEITLCMIGLALWIHKPQFQSILHLYNFRAFSISCTLVHWPWNDYFFLFFHLIFLLYLKKKIVIIILFLVYIFFFSFPHRQRKEVVLELCFWKNGLLSKRLVSTAQPKETSHSTSMNYVSYGHFYSFLTSHIYYFNKIILHNYYFCLEV